MENLIDALFALHVTLQDADMSFGSSIAIDARNAIIDLEADHSRLISTMQELACLGNGERQGNSIGNSIAQKCLSELHFPPAA